MNNQDEIINYYKNNFIKDLIKVVKRPGSKYIYSLNHLGNEWALNRAQALERIPKKTTPEFLLCLYLLILIDQAVHHYFGVIHLFFEKLTKIPKFAVGAGHKKHMDPYYVFIYASGRNGFSMEQIIQILPFGMPLFVDECTTFFSKHMPYLPVENLFTCIVNDSCFKGSVIHEHLIKALEERGFIYSNMTK